MYNSATSIGTQSLVGYKPDMSSLRLQDTVFLTEQHPELSFDQVQRFISLASRLKDDILLTQLSFVHASNPP